MAFMPNAQYILDKQATIQIPGFEIDVKSRGKIGIQNDLEVDGRERHGRAEFGPQFQAPTREHCRRPAIRPSQQTRVIADAPGLGRILPVSTCHDIMKRVKLTEIADLPQAYSRLPRILTIRSEPNANHSRTQPEHANYLKLRCTPASIFAKSGNEKHHAITRAA